MILLIVFPGIIVCILLYSCGNPKKLSSIHGQFLGKPLITTVDSKLAGLILTEQSDYRVKQLFDKYEGKPLNNLTLGEIAKNYSVDVATFYFLQCQYQHIKNKEAQDLFYSYSEEMKTGNLPGETMEMKDYFIAFVPGFAYKNDSTTGADFSKQRRLLLKAGIENELIETDEWGLSENNAVIIANKLRALSERHQKIIVVSASKGGLETAIAVGKIMKQEETNAIKAWVSVGGILRGSPIADQYLKGPKRLFAEFILWTKGKKIDLVKDMSYKRRVVGYKEFQFPSNIKIIHFVGAPLATQISKIIKRRYYSLIKLGPNDGITTLPDEISENGIVVTGLGLDHYFNDPNIDRITFALAYVAVKIFKMGI